MIIAALFYWIRSYLPALFSDNYLPEGSIIGYGILSGVVLILALSMLQWLVKDIEIPLSKKWWSRTQYHRLLRTILLFAIFMTLGWTSFAIVFGLTGTTGYTSVAWFISGTLFLSSLILFLFGRTIYIQKTNPLSCHPVYLALSASGPLEHGDLPHKINSVGRFQNGPHRASLPRAGSAVAHRHSGDRTYHPTKLKKSVVGPYYTSGNNFVPLLLTVYRI